MKKLDIYLIVLLLCGGLSILTFWNDNSGKAQTIILFVTFISIILYVRDTHRIANSTMMQSRIYWISNLFVSLSVRIDGFIKDIEGPSLFPENWEVHIREIRSSLEVLLNLWSSKAGKNDINKLLEECSLEFQMSPMREQEKSRLINFLLQVKKELQIMVGQLG